MKHDTIQTNGMTGICTAKPEYVKLKVERKAEPMTHDGHRQALNPALPALAMPPQGQDGQTAHPSNLGDSKRTPETWVGKESAAMKDENSFGKAQSLPKELGLALDKSSKHNVEIDTANYQKYLDDPALTDDQKEEIVAALWTVITGFMDLGFGVYPMPPDHDEEPCGKHRSEVDREGNEDSNDPKPLQDAFNAASDDT